MIQTINKTMKTQKTAISNSGLARIAAKLELCKTCGVELKFDEDGCPYQFCQNCKTELFPSVFRTHRKGLCFCEDCEKTKKLELNK